MKKEATCFSETWFIINLHGVTSKKTAFFIVTAVRFFRSLRDCVNWY
jgi:hypothetical protein